MSDAQLAMFPRRGGKRRGAGRKPGPSPRVRHLRRPPITRHVAGHVTLQLREGLPSLRRARLVRALEASFQRGAERGDFRLLQYSIQADHLHAIVEASDSAALGRGMMALATRVARAVNRVFRRRR
jgi:putative transposase